MKLLQFMVYFMENPFEVGNLAVPIFRTSPVVTCKQAVSFTFKPPTNIKPTSSSSVCDWPRQGGKNTDCASAVPGPGKPLEDCHYLLVDIEKLWENG